MASHIRIITPEVAEARGCQLSLLVPKIGKQVFERISQAGIIGDWREPDVIRLSPVPLYNTFEDVFRCGEILAESIDAIVK